MEGVRYKRRHAIGFLLYEEGPRNPGTFKWKIVYYPYMFKLQSPSKYSPFDAIHLLRLFPTAQNSFWTCWFWCLLVLRLFFVSPLPHQQKYFPVRTFFIWGNKKQVTWGVIGWIGRVRHRGHAVFGQVPSFVNHPSWNGQTCWNSLQKIHWSWTQPLTTMPAGTLLQMGS